ELAPPAAILHRNAIAHALVALRVVDEDMLLERFRIAIANWARQGRAELHGSDVEDVLYNRHPESYCRINLSHP
ncbi:MAG: hypothetical protein ABI678_23140, partial [Kofleriaceae bacterium]